MRTALILLTGASLAYFQEPVPHPEVPTQISKSTAQPRNASPKAKPSAVPIQAPKDQANGGDVADEGKGKATINIGTIPRLSVEEPKDVIDYALAIATILLVGVGSWQLYLMKQTVDAAKASADAALRSIELVISKERSRLEISMDVVRLEHLLNSGTVHVVARNDGMTAAYNVWGEAWCGLKGTVGIVERHHVGIIKPDKAMLFTLSISPPLSPDEVTKIRERALFLVVVGNMTFDDAFGNRRVYRFGKRLWWETPNHTASSQWLNTEDQTGEDTHMAIKQPKLRIDTHARGS